MTHLVGGWHGTLLSRARADVPFERVQASCENQWVLGRQFVQMTLRLGDAVSNWSAVFYVGHEDQQRRHVLVSVEPGDNRMTVRRGEWTADRGKLVLTTQDMRVVYDISVPGNLSLELVDRSRRGNGVAQDGSRRRFVIA